MKAPQRIIWSEGMFMSPHHMQQLDLYHESLLETRLGSVSLHPWGVVSMQFDMEALRAGQVHLLEFFGILPDGLAVAFDAGQEESPAARPVEGHFRPTQQVLELYLGIPKERSDVESYGAAGKVGSSPRFSPRSRSVGDLHASTSIVQIAFAQRNMKLLFGHEPRDDFEAIKIAELARDKSGSLVLVEGYIPPCLRVSASPFIMTELRSLLRLIVSKQRQLASRRRHRDASSLEYTASDVTLFLELHALNGIVPFLSHVIEAGNMRPHDLYLMLSRFAGQLCTFSADADPALLPPFQFTNLRATFEEMFRRLIELMHSVALEQCLTVPMERGQDGLYRAKLEDERFERCGQFLLMVRSELPEQLVADQLPKLSKLGSGSEIQGLVQAAAPGVPLQVTYRPPPEVPVRPGASYFSLSVQDGGWRTVMRERSVALFLPHIFNSQHTSIELLAVPTVGR
ncbi:type VI secretion system baseplate subunit TssK [Hyalangium rubrum]|uniref:Type VI secretion system baseplate subunit TssK n=1 Tax=Hyalangium rubrum TaxID=3103134 RepID=A0ABU5GXI8_9BACT|nr:type VI secretion system baseplate subunit TssK [Hyalangium sp. s54d21]MDY7225751.1 type VI secretion system baseplate subunit TssK [Hyalangium sp. s54d21]